MKVLRQLNSFFQGVADAFITIPAPSSNSVFPPRKSICIINV